MNFKRLIGFSIVAGGALFAFKFLSRMSDIDLLARTIWGEARGENTDGRVGVANVVMNRVADPRWPNSVKAVVLQPLQFSAWNTGDPNRPQLLAVTTDNPIFEESVAIATQAVDGDLEDITGGAVHYFSKNITPPVWSRDLPLLSSFGSHKFFG